MTFAEIVFDEMVFDQVVDSIRMTFDEVVGRRYCIKYMLI
jgi:hypothetical protein